MSYIQFQQKCKACGAEWNAAFGIVGTNIIAQPPPVCPKCTSPNIERVADGWKTSSGEVFPTGTETIPSIPSITKNSETLADFVKYCEAHPEERFWQALRNWSGWGFIYALNLNQCRNGWCVSQNTFYFKGKDG